MSRVNKANLNAGIRFWLEEKPRWGRDFHNSFYKHLGELGANGLTEQWWKTIPDILWEWVAIRPMTKLFIRERGRDRLSDLATGYKQLLSKCKAKTPKNILLKWEDVELLFTVAKKIKGVQSPVFASKLCHFIAPGVFPVIDQEVLGGSNNYKDYWQHCKMLWQEVNDKNSLMKILSNTIGNGVISDYPYTTKITELCLIGERTSV